MVFSKNIYSVIIVYLVSSFWTNVSRESLTKFKSVEADVAVEKLSLEEHNVLGLHSWICTSMFNKRNQEIM